MSIRSSVRATEDAMIRLLKNGHPISANIVKKEEDTRLPVFQNVSAQPVRNFGVDGISRVVIAKGRKDVWFVDIKRRGGKVTLKDCKAFLGVREKIQEQYKSQKVTGWLVTTADIETKGHSFINNNECFATEKAAKR